MKEIRSKYVLMNRNKLTFLIHGNKTDFERMFPCEWCNEIEVMYHGRTRKYIETKSLKAAMCYGNKSAAEYTLARYNRESFHQNVPDFHIAKIDICYEI